MSSKRGNLIVIGGPTGSGKSALAVEIAKHFGAPIISTDSRQFYRGIPDELEEASYVDGYGVFKTFFNILLPCSVPMLITVFVLSFSWQWTDNFYTTLFFTSTGPKLMPDIVAVPSSLDTSLAGGTMFSSAITNTCGLLIIIPLLIIYLFAQRYIMEGIERSGITG